MEKESSRSYDFLWLSSALLPLIGVSFLLDALIFSRCEAK